MRFPKTLLSCSRVRQGVGSGGAVSRRRPRGRESLPASRSLLCILVLTVLGLGALAGTALAQTPPPGPVHFPPPGTTHALPAPAPSLAQAAPSAPVHFPPPSASNPLAATPAPSAAPTAPQGAASAEDIHDIRGPISIPYPWLWAVYLAGGLAVAAGLYAAWRLLRRQAATKAGQPFEIALERLEAARALMTESQVREYAFAVSEIIRVYIEQRFGEKAARRTTEEFLSDLLEQAGTPLAAHRRLLEDFLNHCDLPKFARWQLSVREMESMHESARAFILDTRPRPEPAKPAQAETPAQPELLQAK
jgi:hypothetical protein